MPPELRKPLAFGFALGGIVAILPYFILLPCLLGVPILLIKIARLPRFHAFAVVLPALLIIAVVISLPKPWQTRRFGPFKATTVTFADLAASRAIVSAPEQGGTTIMLPNTNPTKLEIINAITNQTPYRARIRLCFDGSCLLSGPFAGPISIRSPAP